MVDMETRKRLLEEKIPADDYATILTMADNLNIAIDEEDPADAFKEAVIKLNERRELPSYMAEYCTRFDVGHELPEIEMPETSINY